MAGRRTKRSAEWWATNNPAESGVYRCVASVQDGSQCLRIAMDEGLACDLHAHRAPLAHKRAAEKIMSRAETASDRLWELAEDPTTDPAVRAKIYQDALDRAGFVPSQVHKIMPIQDDPIEKLFQSILEDPEGLADPIPEQPAPKALEAPVDAAQEAYDRLTESHRPDAEVVALSPQPSDFGQVGPHAMSPAKTVRVNDSGKTPKHIREGIERMGRQQRGWR